MIIVKSLHGVIKVLKGLSIVSRILFLFYEGVIAGRLQPDLDVDSGRQSRSPGRDQKY